jgi:hypothetical protein
LHRIFWCADADGSDRSARVLSFFQSAATSSVVAPAIRPTENVVLMGAAAVAAAAKAKELKADNTSTCNHATEAGMLYCLYHMCESRCELIEHIYMFSCACRVCIMTVYVAIADILMCHYCH